MFTSITQNQAIDCSESWLGETMWVCETTTLLSMSPVPSPKSLLLCPRGTSLASLILSSKFMQDKCYSDCACAELLGLPREICTGEAVKLAPMGLKIACSAVCLSELPCQV